jgi:hypothetical protein
VIVPDGESKRSRPSRDVPGGWLYFLCPVSCLLSVALPWLPGLSSLAVFVGPFQALLRLGGQQESGRGCWPGDGVGIEHKYLVLLSFSFLFSLFPLLFLLAAPHLRTYCQFNRRAVF